jgi:hypothetical protein
MGGARGGILVETIAHLAVALAIQFIVARVTRNWWAGGLAAIAWAVSREIAQAEYRWIETFGGGLRANLPWWGAFDSRVWPKADQWLDWILPTIAAIAIASIADRRSKK